MKPVAIITRVAGPAHALRGDAEIALAPGDEVFLSDILRTGDNAKLELKFADNSELDLGPHSKVAIEDFVFDEADTPPSFGIHVFEGLARTASGKIVEQNPDGFVLSTPLGTAGIRGTVIWADVSESQVIFMVTELGTGHTVVINTGDNRQVVIFIPDTGVVITEGDVSPLSLFDITPQQLEDYLNKIFQEDPYASTPEGFYVMADASFLAQLGAIDQNPYFVSFADKETFIGMLEEMGVERGPLDTVFGQVDPPSFDSITPPVAGPSTITLSGTGAANTIMGTPGQNHIVNGLAGNDLIVVYGGQDQVQGGYGSHDYITKFGNMSGGFLYGDEAEMTGVTADIGDYIILRTEGQAPLADAEDTGLFGVAEFSGGIIAGDGHTLNNVDTSGGTGGGGSFGDPGSDIIDPNLILTNGDFIGIYGNMTGGTISGDGIIILNAAPSSYQGSDRIVIAQGLDANGNHAGGEMSGGVIYGDAQYFQLGENSTAYLGSDTIEIHILSGNAAVYGDAYSLRAGGNSVVGGNDAITVDTMKGGSIYGDVYSHTADLPIFNTGNDIVTVNNLENGTIYGDAGDYRTGNMSGFAGFGGDGIIIAKTMTGGTIYGDAKILHVENPSPGDAQNYFSDTIKIIPEIVVGVMNDVSGTIYGDAEELQIVSTGGGNIESSFNDTIIINGNFNGTVYGDSKSLNLTLGKMEAGSIDYAKITDALKDTIHVEGTLYGTIYGDTKDAPVYSVEDPAFSIDSFGGDTITLKGGINGGKVFAGFGDDHVTIGGTVSTGDVNLGTGADSLLLGSLQDGSILHIDFGNDSAADTLDIANLNFDGNATLYLYNYNAEDLIDQGSSWTGFLTDTNNTLTHTSGNSTINIIMVNGSLTDNAALIHI